VAKIADQTHHGSLDMVLVYKKSAELLSAENAALNRWTSFHTLSTPKYVIYQRHKSPPVWITGIG
jgi:hypothetical protein